MITFSCKHCGGEVAQKDLSKHGRQPEFCSEQCKKAHRKLYFARWSAENRDRIREYKDRIRDQVRAWNRDFYARHRERRKQLRIGYYKANPEKSLAAAKEYAERNPELIRALSRKSRMKRRALLLEAFVESVDPKVVFQRDRGVCGICMTPVEPTSKWEIDHKVPLSKGGAHSYKNVQLAHRRCNRSKAAKVPQEAA